jgi:hypothetical protein
VTTVLKARSEGVQETFDLGQARDHAIGRGAFEELRGVIAILNIMLAVS